MYRATIFILSICMICMIGCRAGVDEQAAIPLPDTQENRMEAARRYLEAVPPEEMLSDFLDNMGTMFSEEQLDQVKKVCLHYIDLKAYEEYMIESMTKHFTAEELDAMADFYGSKVGKSVMEKMGKYMAEAMPFMQQQMMAAVQKAKEAGEI